jgi:hypothetical protein
MFSECSPWPILEFSPKKPDETFPAILGSIQDFRIEYEIHLISESLTEIGWIEEQALRIKPTEKLHQDVHVGAISS